MASSYASVGEAAEALAAGLGKVGKSIFHSGQAILDDAGEDAIKNSRGILGTIAQARHGVTEVVNGAEKELVGKGDVLAAAGRAFSNAAGNGTDWGTVAGSYIGASATYRVLSGGGLYKDKNGNNNLIGVPFI